MNFLKEFPWLGLIAFVVLWITVNVLVYSNGGTVPVWVAVAVGFVYGTFFMDEVDAWIKRKIQ